jgi:hypothetical protein
MKTRPLPLVLAIMVLVMVRTAMASEVQVDQRELAQQLLGQDAGARGEAIATTLALGPQKTGPGLRAALIALLDRETQIIDGVAARGGFVETVVNPDEHSRVCQAIAELRDPSAIPALARGLGTCGWVIHRYLADFGEQAAPAVLAVVTSPKSSVYAVDEGLIALRFMVEGAGKRPLSAVTLEGIRRAAGHRLIGKQYFTTLWWAIDLAVVLNDPDLKKIVEALASDVNAVMARGVDQPHLIEKTQQIAIERLAGAPPLPRR